MLATKSSLMHNVLMQPENESSTAKYSTIIRRVQNAKFVAAYWGKGYDKEEVDDYLDSIMRSFSEGHRPSPAELRNAAFTVTWLRPGYAVVEVRSLLEEIARYSAG